MSEPSRKKFLVGLGMIIAAFLCVLGVIDLLVNAHQQKISEVKQLKEKMLLLDTEKSVAEQKAKDLQEKLGHSVSLSQLMAESKKVYGPAESRRKDGYLWVDHKTKTLVVTLGALNGLKPDSRLAIYNGNSKICEVAVTKALNVIAYVRLLHYSIDDLTSDSYRAVIE